MMINKKVEMIKELLSNFLEQGIETDELENLKNVFCYYIDCLEDEIKDEAGVI
tara:strand:+ start:288 stop:446 length:159 start_codon:yes stop_codon:yes gene_type:complete